MLRGLEDTTAKLRASPILQRATLETDLVPTMVFHKIEPDLSLDLESASLMGIQEKVLSSTFHFILFYKLLCASVALSSVSPDICHSILLTSSLPFLANLRFYLQHHVLRMRPNLRSDMRTPSKEQHLPIDTPKARLKRGIARKPQRVNYRESPPPPKPKTPKKSPKTVSEEYAVDKILDERLVKGQTEYLIRWESTADQLEAIQKIGEGGRWFWEDSWVSSLNLK